MSWLDRARDLIRQNPHYRWQPEWIPQLVQELEDDERERREGKRDGRDAVEVEGE